MSDYLMAEVKKIYIEEQCDFEPKFFPLFSLVSNSPGITITEAADSLGLSHPAVIQFASELSRKKLITFKADLDDRRKRRIYLTSEGEERLERLSPVWRKIKHNVDEVLAELDSDLVSSLAKLEKSFEKLGLTDRYFGSGLGNKEVEIVDYIDSYRDAFEKLNREWLEEYFEVEPSDEKAFANPKEEILVHGGEIFFAKLDGELVGTCAVLNKNNRLEISKMVVTENHRRKKIGESLMKEVLNRAKKLGINKLELHTNSSLIPARNLYKKFGFKESLVGQHPIYKRGNLGMELNL